MLSVCDSWISICSVYTLAFVKHCLTRHFVAIDNMLRRTLCWITLFVLTACIAYSEGSCDCRQNLTSVFSQVNITLATYTSTCPLYDSFKICYDNRPAECNTTGPDDIISDIYTYTCGDGYEKILRTGECWTRSDVIAAVRDCSVHLNPNHLDDKCSAYTNYYNCLNTSMQTLCNQEAYEVMTEFVMASTRLERERFGCPDPVIVRPPLNILCYDCHSGGSSWINPHCYVNGTITGVMVGETICSDSCMAKTDKWNEGVAYRGCATQFLPDEYPRPLPRFGCRDFKGETWCFCDGPRCNNMSMTEYV